MTHPLSDFTSENKYDLVKNRTIVALFKIIIHSLRTHHGLELIVDRNLRHHSRPPLSRHRHHDHQHDSPWAPSFRLQHEEAIGVRACEFVCMCVRVLLRCCACRCVFVFICVSVCTCARMCTCVCRVCANEK